MNLDDPLDAIVWMSHDSNHLSQTNLQTKHTPLAPPHPEASCPSATPLKLLTDHLRNNMASNFKLKTHNTSW